ncbi:PREDICTED: major facilitator superfamily domain-containing protein 1-like [Amphimedon queenslandica]|uniref:Lysosomal dipeptide transporter MFSD1 n=1 Tax=Amphimedon queenslandica TaxID=400682 RepID=A0A1X7UHR9_AMPQE|nr:PREDICTED: major facilitator superfamily domain-containing protein 1-like [Amphimedon queenslandica]|eukprot:XP_003387966.1 PREDICTED: major facilitator superfamily domain-containing protein 1-like [Amphimedon queenslandica]
MSGENLYLTSSWCTHWTYKYLFLSFLSSVRLLSNYCLELPSGIEDTIIKVMGVTTAEYDLLFSVTAWPNIFLCLVGGILIDRLVGLRLGLLIMVVCVLLGQIVWGIGGIANNYYIMLAGRFFIGAGNELVTVIDHAFKAIWFKEDLSLAISIDIGFSRIGGTLAILLPQLIYDSLTIFHSPTFRLGVTLLTAAGLMIIGLAFSLIVFGMDCKREKVIEQPLKLKNLKRTTMNDFKQFSLLFWLTTAINVTYFPVIFSFVGIGQDFFIQKYGLSMEVANLANSLLFGSALILVPIAGILITKTGFHLLWLLSFVLTTALPALLIFMFSNGESYFPFVAGVFYSLSYTFSGPSFTALPAFLIDKENMATAFGILNSSYNAAYSLVTYVTGLIIDTLGYFVLQGFFIHIIMLSIDFTLLTVIFDAASNKPNLNVPGLWLRCKAIKE